MRTILTDELLDQIHENAALYDAQNRFPDADFEALRAAGYLTAMAPADLGGGGLTLIEMAHEQMRLAGASPALALAVNMHQVWIGVARALLAAGDHSMDFVLQEACAGEVFAFGISEPGNDLVLFGSISEARPDDDGGYGFYGTKIFTSLSPVWTRLGTFGADRTADEPTSVFGFITREGGGFRILDDWDTLGMRASQSCTTLLEGAHAPADRIVRRIPAGLTKDPFVVAIFANFEILLACVYTGVARRALDLAIAGVRRRTSVKNQGAPYSADPDTRWLLADAAIALDGVYPQIESVARDVDAGIDRGDPWLPQLSAVKARASETALRVVEQSVRAAGGSSYFTRNELSRLYRDALAGVFHPSNDASTHAAWARLILGPIP